MCKSFFNTIDAFNAQFIKVLEDICNIESPTDYKLGVDAVGAYIIDFSHKQGFKTECFEQNIAGNVVCVTMNADSPKAPIVLSGHMDTVHKVGSFGTPAVRFENDKILGPGVCDCKGGIVAALLAMVSLKQCGYCDRPIMLLLQSDEESNSKQSDKATVKYICEKSKNAVAFLNMEPYSPGNACLLRKGIITYRFTVNGVAAHASKCANEGLNAIEEAVGKILQIARLKDDDGVTCCCSLIYGGTVVNAVPDQCEFYVDARFASADQQKWLQEKMQEIADHEEIKGCKTNLSVVSMRPAMENSDKNYKLLECINNAFKTSGLPVLKAVKSNGGSDAAYISERGIPCVDSLGVSGENIHSHDEFAFVDSLAESAKRIAAIADCFSNIR